MKQSGNSDLNDSEDSSVLNQNEFIESFNSLSSNKNDFWKCNVLPETDESNKESCLLGASNQQKKTVSTDTSLHDNSTNDSLNETPNKNIFNITKKIKRENMRKELKHHFHNFLVKFPNFLLKSTTNTKYQFCKIRNDKRKISLNTRVIDFLKTSSKSTKCTDGHIIDELVLIKDLEKQIQDEMNNQTITPLVQLLTMEYGVVFHNIYFLNTWPLSNINLKSDLYNINDYYIYELMNNDKDEEEQSKVYLGLKRDLYHNNDDFIEVISKSQTNKQEDTEKRKVYLELKCDLSKNKVEFFEDFINKKPSYKHEVYRELANEYHTK